MLETCTFSLLKEGITEYAILPFSAVRLQNPALLERGGAFTVRSVLIYAVPYYTGKADNLSAYAVSRDYHLYMRSLSERLIAAITDAFPTATARAFSDHSPIDERHAAAIAGLGVIGDNGLLITQHHGSYVFLGEIFTDIPAPEDVFLHTPGECDHCGACRRACPTGALEGKGDCLSELTQRRGELAPDTVRLMKKHHTVWGCDLCQSVCPYNIRAVERGLFTPISFFHEERIPHLTSAKLAAMDKQTFEERAYAWRGRNTVARNLAAYEAEDIP